jgi:hypothetical protein
VTASKRGLPALDQILNQIPPLLTAFDPFLRNADPIVRYIAAFKPDITAFFGNVTAASQAFDTQSPFATGQAVHYLRASQTLTPTGLAFYPRALGIDRNNAYRDPSAFNALRTGLSSLDSATCSNGNPAPPTSAIGSLPISASPQTPIPPTVVQLIQQYVFRTSGRDVAAPRCWSQGPIHGYSTLFPHLTADPPPSVASSR